MSHSIEQHDVIAEHLLAQLSAQNITVSLQGDELRIRSAKGMLTPELRDRIAATKPALLALLRKQRPDLDADAVVDLGARGEPFPMLDIQKAYWMGRQGAFAVNSAIRNYYELDCEDLDIARLDAAWTKVLERHEMMRAVALPDFMQRILPIESCCYQIEQLDLRHLDTEQQQRELSGLRERQIGHMFRPEQWPMFRIVAARLDDRRTRLLFDLDCLNIDGASGVIVARDWIRFYRDPSWSPVALGYSFRDYALAAQRQRDRGSEQRAAALDYWRRRAEVLPPPPQLPTIRQPTGAEAVRFSRKRATLDARTWAQLKTRAASMDVTPTCAVLGAFSEVLAGWSTSRKLTLNLTMLHRLPLHPEVNDIAGDFTSMVLLGLDLDLGSTFRERIAHAQRQLLADMDHMSLSGPEILQQISSITGARGGGAFPVVFSSFLNNAMDGGSLAQLGAPAYVITNTPQLTFDHQVFQEDGQLVLIWDCVDGTYPEGMLDDMIVAYRALLEQMAHGDEVWNQERLSLVPRAHLDLFERVNRTEAPTSDKRLHELFLDQVARRGSAAAVVTRTTTLTYDELERSSAVLARILRDMGAGPGQLVAVVMEKGWEQVVGSLAVMRSGAAYVPIDPALPAERVRYLLEDGAVAVALVQPHLRDAIAWPEGVSVVAVSGSLHGAAGTDSAPIDQVQRLEDLAYVIYTSGSTGRPKGVMIEHRNAVNTIVAINQRFAVGPNDRVLALSALNFDLSVYDLFGTLAAGGTIVMPDVATTRDPEALSALVAEQGVTLWSSVPALVELWIEHARKAAPPAKLAVRLVMMSGDWIPVALPDKIRELLPDVALSSLGGATEPAIWSVAYPIGEVDPAWKSIPYGGPLPNQTVCVLDDRLMPRPVWVPGEIYFGGLGVGRGYWHDDERTRAAFIVHPRTQERLYRSGDLGRYLPDGNLEILGRVDFQVKIRGYRIELGEIEAALVQHPAVSAAVATVYGETSAQQRLVAYAVPRERRHLETGAAVTSESRALLEFKLAGTGLRGDLAGQAALAFDGQASLENLPPRRSIRRFERTEVSASSLERLLGSLRGIAVPGAPLPTYRYPSAGSTYAVQTYLYAGAGRVQRLAEGIYYYHPERHELLRVSDGSIDRAAFAAVNHRLFDDSAFTLFLVGQPKAVEPLYGALTDRFLLLEAGYMSQLLMTEAPAAGLGLCPIGDLRFAAVAPQFALDGAQPCLHALCGGAVAQDAYTHAVSYDEPDALRDDSLVDELKRALRQKLPDYMVPATIVVLEALPLTANGKVDRKRLPEPGGADRVGATTEFTPPTGDLEQRLGALVCEILRLPRVSVHDNWFELGGTSMSLVRLYQRLGEVSATEIAIVEMFAHPTVASLAKRLADGTASAAAGRSAERGRSRAELRRSLSGQGRLKT